MRSLQLYASVAAGNPIRSAANRPKIKKDVVPVASSTVVFNLYLKL